MVKFIDKSRKDDACKDEILMRCTCGNEILSIGVVNGIMEDKTVIPVLRFKFYQCGSGPCKSTKDIDKSAIVHFGEPEAINTIYSLLKGETNGGHGYVESQEGYYIGFDLADTDDAPTTIHFAFTEKDIHKIYKYLYKGKPEKADNIVAWSVGFERPELEKLIAFIAKIVGKLNLPKEEPEKTVDGETEVKPSSDK
jgi:hypothetical protein